ncbi:unknown [Crocosphaera subtropica ATCC 51142]|uniref:Uncharacterized protein n=1 Tax=Crocosphaera subtropica (strain ATCC 51142 / BH68) TaxID=43989 RepID=B1X155_CROS5|nr:hypothetical protein [Crocosphaera subtropica]ACB49696.1 unknown [Crocosphaera subtropica ATCC 51142]
MTPEERLSQIEALFETAARYTVRHEEAISRNEEAIARHEETLTRLDEQIIQTNLRMAELAEIVRELGQYQRESSQRIDQIWEYLMRQNGNGRGSN